MEFKPASVSVVKKTSMITRSRRDLINVYTYGLSSAALPYQFIMKTKTKVYCNVVCVDHNNVGVLFYPIH